MYCTYLAPVPRKMVKSLFTWRWGTNCTIHWIEIYPVDSAVHFLNNSSPRMLRHIRDVLTVQSAIFEKVTSDKEAKIQREWEEMAK